MSISNVIIQSQTIFPPKAIEKIAPIYEAETDTISGQVYVYRRLDKYELNEYYLSKDSNVDFTKKRIFLFTRDNMEEVNRAVNAYFSAIQKLYRV